MQIFERFSPGGFRFHENGIYRENAQILNKSKNRFDVQAEEKKKQRAELFGFASMLCCATYSEAK